VTRCEMVGAMDTAERHEVDRQLDRLRAAAFGAATAGASAEEIHTAVTLGVEEAHGRESRLTEARRLREEIMSRYAA
jgi:hypothetical protein